MCTAAAQARRRHWRERRRPAPPHHAATQAGCCKHTSEISNAFPYNLGELLRPAAQTKQSLPTTGLACDCDAVRLATAAAAKSCAMLGWADGRRAARCSQCSQWLHCTDYTCATRRPPLQAVPTLNTIWGGELPKSIIYYPADNKVFFLVLVKLNMSPCIFFCLAKLKSTKMNLTKPSKLTKPKSTKLNNTTLDRL